MQPQLINTVDETTKFIGKRVYLGTRQDFATKDELTGLISHHSLFHPVWVRAVDNNKYDAPHQSQREMNRRKKQLNG
jgi:hypothetical protein